MESDTGNVRGNDQMILPPGFRFHPTDEELITHYLSKKVINSGFSAVAVSDVDMNRVEPWELPWKAKIGENEWYFFCAKDKKYPTGHRTNRATASGYWKSTGKDKEIFRGKSLVGMKKTLVFYKGRAPKGEKTNWVAHEYRLEGKCAHDNLTKSDWVIMRVFHKSCGGKKFHLAELTRPSRELVSSSSSLTRSVREHNEPGSSHVSCFSSLVPNDDIIHGNFATCFDNPIISSTSDHVDSFELDDYAFSVGQLSCSIEIDISNENLSQILKQGRDQ